MANTYYSGQGKFLVGDRVDGPYFADDGTTPAKVADGLTELGNVSALAIDIETTKYEHKESETGNRAVDISIIQEKKGTFTMTLENVNGFNLALALWGNTTANAGTAIGAPGAEQIRASHDKPVPLLHPDISAVTVGDDDLASPTTTYVLDTDYTLDTVNGTITALSTGSITDAQVIYVQYTYAANTVVEAFTKTSSEYWLRFNGLNTIDDSNVIVDAFKCAFDPLTGYDLINEEIAQLEITGNILLDDTQPTAVGTNSQFFREVIFNAA